MIQCATNLSVHPLQLHPLRTTRALLSRKSFPLRLIFWGSLHRRHSIARLIFLSASDKTAVCADDHTIRYAYANASSQSPVATPWFTTTPCPEVQQQHPSNFENLTVCGNLSTWLDFFECQTLNVEPVSTQHNARKDGHDAPHTGSVDGARHSFISTPPVTNSNTAFKVMIPEKKEKRVPKQEPRAVPGTHGFSCLSKYFCIFPVLPRTTVPTPDGRSLPLATPSFPDPNALRGGVDNMHPYLIFLLIS